MPRGGYRPNAKGPKKGAKYRPTLAKEAAREVVREMVTRHLQPLIEAQIANAMGLKYLVTRDKKSGKFIRVTEAMARVKLGDHEEVIEVWEKDPNVHAFADLLNRALGKPQEQPQDININGQVRVPLFALPAGDDVRVLPLLPGSDV